MSSVDTLSVEQSRALRMTHGARPSLARTLFSPLLWIWQWRRRRTLAVIHAKDPLDEAKVESLIRLGDRCLREGTTDLARQAYARAARCLAAVGEQPRAASLLRQVTSADPSDAAARLELAQMLRGLGRRKEAAVEYETTARLVEAELPIEAMRCLSIALTLDPTHSEARARLAVLEAEAAPRLNPYAFRVCADLEAISEHKQPDVSFDSDASAPPALARLPRTDGNGEGEQPQGLAPERVADAEDLVADAEDLVADAEDLKNPEVDDDELDDPTIREEVDVFGSLIPVELVDIEPDATRKYGADPIELLVSCALDEDAPAAAPKQTD